MTDSRILGLRRDGLVRLTAVVLTGAVREICQRHGLRGARAEAMARALVATSLLPFVDKEGGRLSIQWAGRGPFGVLHTDLRDGTFLRGYLSGEGEAPTVRDGVGRGILVVMKQPPRGSVTQGQVPLLSSQIDEDLERYLHLSEQVPSRLRVFVRLDGGGEVATAAGLLAQAMPGGDEGDLDDAQELDPGLWVRDAYQGGDAAELFALATRGTWPEPRHEAAPAFACTCSRARVEASVAMLGAEELLSMVVAGEGTAVRCEFCAENYEVGVADLLRILSALGPADGGPEGGPLDL